MELSGHEPAKNLDIYNETDYILYYLSSHPEKMTSMNEIKNVFYALNQNGIINDNDSGNSYKVKRLLNNYCRLGYINYFYDRESEESSESYKIAVNRPTLIMLPPRYEASISPGIGGKTQKKFVCMESWYKFLLTGARSPEFVQRLIKTCKNKNDIRVQINKSETPLYPHEILVWANTEVAIKELAESLNISLQFCVYSKMLFSKLGDINSYINNIKETKPQYYDNINSFEVIDFQNLNDVDSKEEYKIPVKHTINKEGDVACYWPGTGYNEEYILWDKGKVLPLEKFWANYVGALYNKKQIIKVEDYHIIVPYKFRFPVIFDRALTLISGKLPEIIFINGRRQYLDYSLYDSPFIHINSSTIANKLNQYYNHG